MDFTPEEIDELLKNIDKFSAAEAAEIEKMVDELTIRREREGARDDLIKFCLYVDPNYKVGRHHRILANMLMDLENGRRTAGASTFRRGTARASLFPSISLRGSLGGIRVRR